MKAFLIDGKAHTVTELDHSTELDDIYKDLQCRTFQAIRLTKNAVMFIDEEARLTDEPRTDLFFIQGVCWGKPCEWDVYGRGLVFGPEDGDAEVTPAPFSKAELVAMIRFVSNVLN